MDKDDIEIVHMITTNAVALTIWVSVSLLSSQSFLCNAPYLQMRNTFCSSSKLSLFECHVRYLQQLHARQLIMQLSVILVSRQITSPQSLSLSCSNCMRNNHRAYSKSFMSSHLAAKALQLQILQVLVTERR